MSSTYNIRSDSTTWEALCESSPAIYLRRAENDDPVVTCGVILDELFEHIEAHGAYTEDGEDLK